MLVSQFMIYPILIIHVLLNTQLPPIRPKIFAVNTKRGRNSRFKLVRTGNSAIYLHNLRNTVASLYR